MKINKRKLLGPLFKPLSRVRHSQITRFAMAMLMMPGQIIRARLNYPYFSVNLKGGRGMGALLRDAIQMYNYAEQNKLRVQISSNNPLYSPGKNADVFNTYFESETEDSYPRLRPLKFSNKLDFLHLKFAQNLSIEEGNRIFWTYLRPKPFIVARVNAILDQIPNSKFDLAIHYRGTDKVREAPLVNFSIFKAEIDRYRDCYGPIKTGFLATDEPIFERYIRNEFPDVIFQTYNLVTPADITHGRHFSDMAAEDKAIEALVNMLLLARAQCLIRSTSYMSAISKIINPEIRTITLNRTHWGSNNFPEKEILKQEGYDEAIGPKERLRDSEREDRPIFSRSAIKNIFTGGRHQPLPD